MTNMKRKRTDKFTGEELVPVQVWVQPKNKIALQKKAKRNKKTLQDFLRRELEILISGIPF